MKNENLDILVRKYIEAESSESEDQELKEALANDGSPEEYADLRALMGYFELQKSGTAIPAFKNPATAPVSQKRKVIHIGWIAAAASVVILVAALFFFNSSNIGNSTDTFSDPAVAAQNAVNALEILSGELNKGQAIAVEQMKEFDSLNKFLNIY